MIPIVTVPAEWLSPDATLKQRFAINEIRNALLEQIGALTFNETKRWLNEVELKEFEAGCEFLFRERVWGPLADRSEELRKDALFRKVAAEGVVAA